MVSAAARLVCVVQRAPIRFVVALLLAVCVVVLTVSVLGHGGLTVFDGPVLDWVIAHRNGTVTVLAKLLSDVGGTLAMLVLAVVAWLVLVWRRRFVAALAVMVATGGAGVLVVGVKDVVGRVRPPVADHLVTETNQSFPSGHSLGSTVVVGVVAVAVAAWLRRRAVRAVVLAIAAVFVGAVGISRLYLGVHWPTDIVGGWSLGGLWLIVCLAVCRTRRVRRLFARNEDSACNI
ncbi:phosphatase PAP2 family protein [Nocardia sp. NPDC004068]|uniref:phosphatase PAP2 family protein n=1 Tax=Nocardia sp. NPDC004068 TaxID=3364303 RepID=UPI0036A621A1